MYKFLSISVISLTFLFFGCNESIPVSEVDLNTKYAPVEVGKYWEYEVDSIIYDDLGMTVFNTSSFIKEQIINKAEGIDGDSIYMLQVSKKNSVDSDYFATDLWVVKIQNNGLVRIEENLSFIKLLFPPEVGDEWNGNQFAENDVEVFVSGEPIVVYKDWKEYLVEDQLSSYTVGDMSFDDVIVIKHVDEANLIEKRLSYEYYASGVGLVAKEMVILDSQKCVDLMLSQDECDFTEYAEKGYILSQRLIDHN